MLRYKLFYLDQTWTILEKVKVFVFAFVKRNAYIGSINFFQVK